MKEEKKYIIIIHTASIGHLQIIDNIKRISTYDSGVQISGSHSKPNEALKASLESITEKAKAKTSGTGTGTPTR